MMDPHIGVRMKGRVALVRSRKTVNRPWNPGWRPNAGGPAGNIGKNMVEMLEKQGAPDMPGRWQRGQG